MAEGLNKVMLLGNICEDATLRHTHGGSPVVNMRVAVNETFFTKDKEKREKVEYIPVVIWGKLGESVHPYLKKGVKVYCEGKFQTTSYDDRDGNKRWKSECNAHNVILCGGGSGHGSENGGGRRNAASSGESHASYDNGAGNSSDGSDDDIPW